MAEKALYRIEGSDCYEMRGEKRIGAGLRFDPRSNTIVLRIQFDYEDSAEREIPMADFLEEISRIAVSDITVKSYREDGAASALLAFSRWPEA